MTIPAIASPLPFPLYFLAFTHPTIDKINEINEIPPQQSIALTNEVTKPAILWSSSFYWSTTFFTECISFTYFSSAVSTKFCHIITPLLSNIILFYQILFQKETIIIQISFHPLVLLHYLDKRYLL